MTVNYEKKPSFDDKFSLLKLIKLFLLKPFNFYGQIRINFSQPYSLKVNIIFLRKRNKFLSYVDKMNDGFYTQNLNNKKDLFLNIKITKNAS